MAGVGQGVGGTSPRRRGSPTYGDVFEVNLDPIVGSEIGKRRPALIISNDQNNRFADTVTILPMTGRPARKVFAFEVMIPAGAAGLRLNSRIRTDQIRTVDKLRLGRRLGSLSGGDLLNVQKAIKIHLNLP